MLPFPLQTFITSKSLVIKSVSLIQPHGLCHLPPSASSVLSHYSWVQLLLLPAIGLLHVLVSLPRKPHSHSLCLVTSYSSFRTAVVYPIPLKSLFWPPKVASPNSHHRPMSPRFCAEYSRNFTFISVIFHQHTTALLGWQLLLGPAAAPSTVLGI